MQGEGSSLDLDYNNQTLQPGNWLNDTIMANYASLLAGFDTMGIQLLLINPEIVAFIASASLTGSQKELSRVHRWKQGYLRKKVSKQIINNHISYSSIFGYINSQSGLSIGSLS
jgi:hypothetical protein